MTHDRDIIDDVSNQGDNNILYFGENQINLSYLKREAFLAGLKAGRPKWHKVTNWEDNNQFPDDELKTYLVRLYQDRYAICELDITEGYRQFYSSDNFYDIDPQDVVEWCDFEPFKE